jgi:hypothetical protein
MYDNIRDTQFRLQNTVVFYKSKYCYVSACAETPKGEMQLILNDNTAVELSDPNLKIRSIPTGYASVGGRIIYISRNPCRRYRQGLRDDNCTIFDSVNNRLVFKFLQEHAIRGYEERKKVGKATLINRDFILRDTDNKSVHKIFYRRRHVGYMRDGNPYFLNGLDFIKEALQKAMENNND